METKLGKILEIIKVNKKKVLVTSLIVSIILATLISILVIFVGNEVCTLLIIPDVEKQTGYFDGYNLYVVEKRSKIDYKTLNRSLIICDMNGTIIFNRNLSSESALANFNTEFINSTTLIFGDINGVNLWNIETDEVVSLGIYGHHDYEFNPANNTYFTFSTYFVEDNGTEYIFDRIQEYNLNAEVVWTLDTSDFVSTDDWCPYEDKEGDRADVTHSNSIIYDDREDVIYINMRNTNTFYKIDHKTGNLIWALGEHGNFTLYDINGKEKDILFYHGHALEMIGHNSFIYFDNDEHNQTDYQNRRSRILEIEIDEDTMTAYTTWEWIAPLEYFSAWWGDADRLPNSNRLGCFGTIDHPQTDIGARLVEINGTGDIVWELNYNRTGDYSYGIYQVERIRFSPLIEVIPSIIHDFEETACINWKTWYNFRNKYDFNGNYSVILNGNVTNSSFFIFERFWNPTYFETNISLLEKGNHTLTIVVEDEGGHQTSQNVSIAIITTIPKITKLMEDSSSRPKIIFAITLVSLSNDRKLKLRFWKKSKYG